MLTDASGEVRKGIETDMLAEARWRNLHVWNTANKHDCWLISCGCPHYEIGMSEREYETIRDLMLAGF